MLDETMKQDLLGLVHTLIELSHRHKNTEQEK